MEVDLKTDPSAVGEFMMSQRCRDIVSERAELAALLFQAEVAKRTGALARTAKAHTEVGGKRHDRWVGVVSVASGSVYYEAAHEFGYTSKGKDGGHFIPGHHDLNIVLGQLDSA